MTDPGAWEPRRRARRRALQALYQREIAGQEVDGIIIQFLETQDFGGVDEAYFKQLVHGVDERQGELLDALAPLLDRPFGQLDTMERILLLMGAWQLRHDPEVPLPVVLDEAVDLANRFGSAQTHSYVNAVLDRAGRAWRAAEASASPDERGS